MLDEIWAKKPKETLAEHSDAVIYNTIALKERYFDFLPNQQLWKEVFIASVFHDLGKLCNNFQNMIQPNKVTDWDNFVRHEFLSGMYLLISSPNFYFKNPLSLFAVFSHHKALTEELFSKNASLILQIEERNLDEFITYAKNWLEKEPDIKLAFSDKAKESLLHSSYKKLFREYKKHFLPLVSSFSSNERKEYIFRKALLNIADWTASGHRQLEPGIIYNDSFLAEKIIGKLRAEGKIQIANDFKFRTFQENSKWGENILAVAPTGSGKTEAALLWATQKKEFEHIFYLLPTRVTSNAIFKRLCAYFGKEKVAIVHSSAFFLQKDINENYSEKEYAFIDKAFFKNITVCTIDQILTQGFNLGFWEVKTFHQINARFIIDEIHLYQPYTLGLIIATIKYLQNEFGAKFYIMTATMPKKMRILLTKHLNAPRFVADTELLEKARNTFKVKDCSYADIIPEVEKSIKKDLKVLLVLNTVDSAIKAYNDFKPLFKSNEDKILCYHSRFIQKDRSAKETEIFEMEAKKGGCLLVATQVVEVSLDIDFDILFTENAPIDAIIQRAGRINRKRKKENTKVIIFRHSEATKQFVYDIPNILENTFSELKKKQSALTESDLLKLVDKVYANYNVEEEESFKKGLTRYALIQKELNYILDLVSKEGIFTREGLDTVNIIPDKFQEELYEKDIMKKTEYEVAISTKRFNSIKITPDQVHKWFKYADVIYDTETGLKFKKSAKQNNQITQNF